MKFTLHKWVCNVNAVPIPTQYINFDTSRVKPKNRNLSEIGQNWFNSDIGISIAVVTASTSLST